MAILFTPIESTPYRLRYHVERDDANAGNLTGLIKNAGVDPGVFGADLRWNARVWTGSPILSLVSRNPVTVAGSKRELLGDGLTLDSDINVARADIFVTPLFFANHGEWAINVTEGTAAGDPASAGFAVVQVIVPQRDAANPAQAYVDIVFQHSMDR